MPKNREWAFFVELTTEIKAKESKDFVIKLKIV